MAVSPTRPGITFCDWYYCTPNTTQLQALTPITEPRFFERLTSCLYPKFGTHTRILLPCCGHVFFMSLSVTHDCRITLTSRSSHQKPLLFWLISWNEILWQIGNFPAFWYSLRKSRNPSWLNYRVLEFLKVFQPAGDHPSPTACFGFWFGSWGKR